LQIAIISKNLVVCIASLLAFLTIYRLNAAFARVSCLFCTKSKRNQPKATQRREQEQKKKTNATINSFSLNFNAFVFSFRLFMFISFVLFHLFRCLRIWLISLLSPIALNLTNADPSPKPNFIKMNLNLIALNRNCPTQT
jgi:hypothetical protein